MLSIGRSILSITIQKGDYNIVYLSETEKNNQIELLAVRYFGYVKD